VTWKAPDVERPDGPLTGPERPMLQAFLDWQRATLLYKCAGLTGEQLAERIVPPSGLSLLGLVRHMTEVERAWFRKRFAGEPVDDPFGSDKTADFERIDPARAVADYARLRWIYLHMIEEYARHNGHADLLRERTDGATGELLGRGGGVHAGRSTRRGGAHARKSAGRLSGRPPAGVRCRRRGGAMDRVRRRPPRRGRSSPQCALRRKPSPRSP